MSGQECSEHGGGRVLDTGPAASSPLRHILGDFDGLPVDWEVERGNSGSQELVRVISRGRR